MRDFPGSTICSGIKRFNGIWPVKMLEMRAILEGLRSLPTIRASLPHLDIPPVVVISDSIGVVNLLTKEDSNLTEIVERFRADLFRLLSEITK